MADGLALAMAAGIAAALLQAAGFGLMAGTALRATTRPNPVSWLIWSVVATLAALGSWQAGATWPLAGAVANAAGCSVILVVALIRGAAAWSRRDLPCLLAAGCGIAMWAASRDPVAGLLLFLAADACGIVPTIRSVRADPFSECPRGWTLLAAAGVAAVASVEPAQWTWSWQGFGYWGAAVYVALANLLIMTSILTGRMVRRRPDGASAGSRRAGHRPGVPVSAP